MDIRLEKATNADSQIIFDIQVNAFLPLLDKYKDYKTNPANETIEGVIKRINNPNGGFYNEEMFPKAISWELATILVEKRNCYLYEKMGYKKTGVKKKLNENATLIYYKKLVGNFLPL